VVQDGTERRGEESPRQSGPETKRGSRVQGTTGQAAREPGAAHGSNPDRPTDPSEDLPAQDR